MENSQTPQNPGAPVEGESLEGPSEDQAAATGSAPEPDKKPDEPKKKKSGGSIFGKFSIYLLLFALLLVVAIMVVVVVYLHSHTKSTSKITSQNLSQSAINQLSNSDVTVGDAKQVLNVQSNAVFAGQVLVRSDLQIAGKLQVGGGLTIGALNVGGTAIIDTLQVNKNLQVAGDTAMQGGLTVQKSLNVNGGGTFNGAISAPQITTNVLQINGDVNFSHHIIAGGTSPGHSSGNALGGGGTATVNGSDTAGSVTVNTGSSPSAGCFITVNFVNKFNTTPHVVVTPIESGAGGLQYYVTRTSGSFSICSNNAPGAGQSFGFDYIVLD